VTNFFRIADWHERWKPRGGHIVGLDDDDDSY